MADTPILEIPQLATTSTGKETMVNDGFLAMEQSTNQRLEVDFTSGNVTLTATEFLRYFRFIATNLSVPRTLFVETNVREFFVDNTAGTDDLTVDITGSPGSSVTIGSGEMFMVHSDGTDVTLGVGGVPGATSAALLIDTLTTESTTSRTLDDVNDRNAYIRCTNAALTTITVDTTTNEPFAVKEYVYIKAMTDGGVLLSPAGGVTINAAKLTLRKDEAVLLISVAADTWDALFFMGSNNVDWKGSVRAATDAAGTLASDFENGDSVDGVTLATGDRILIQDQASGAENGIYVVNASGAPTRAEDFDEDYKVTSGATVYVEEGTANGGKSFQLTNTGAITVGSTALTFTEFSGSGGGGTTDVQEGGSSVVGSATALNFASADFNITDEGSGVAGIALAGGGGGGGSGSGGSLVFVEEITLSGDSSFTIDVSTFGANGLYFEMDAITVSADGALLKMTINSETTDYAWANRGRNSNNNDFEDSSNGDDAIHLVGDSTTHSLGNDTNEQGTISVRLGQFNASSGFKGFEYKSSHTNPAGAQVMITGSGAWQGGGDAITQVVVAPDTGTFSGRVRVYRMSANAGNAGADYPFAPPTTTDFTDHTVNNGTPVRHTNVDNKGAVYEPQQTGASTLLRAVFVEDTLADTESVTVRITTSMYDANGAFACLCVYDDTDDEYFFVGIGYDLTSGQRLRNGKFGTGGTSETNTTTLENEHFDWFRFRRDGTDMVIEVSHDGEVWSVMDTIAQATFDVTQVSHVGYGVRQFSGASGTGTGGMMMTYYDSPGYPYTDRW